MTREERMNEELARLVGTLQAENAELKKENERLAGLNYDLLLTFRKEQANNKRPRRKRTVPEPPKI